MKEEERWKRSTLYARLRYIVRKHLKGKPNLYDGHDRAI